MLRGPSSLHQTQDRMCFQSTNGSPPGTLATFWEFVIALPNDSLYPSEYPSLRICPSVFGGGTYSEGWGANSALARQPLFLVGNIFFTKEGINLA